MRQFLTPLAAALPATVPFTGPEALEREQGFTFRARLGANESLFGAPRAALEAMRAAVSDVWMYGDPEGFELKQALALKHGCRPENIVIGPGIDGLLGVICRLTLEQGTPVVTSLGAYPTFAYHVAGNGGELIRIPYRGDFEDSDGLLAAARQHSARLIYLANPDNPMGSFHPAPVIDEMIANLTESSLLLLDEAYADLAPPESLPKIPADQPNVIRFRTFSKGYGMAGARVGYAITHPDLARAFDKMRDHFGMGRISLAGALAALSDADWLPQLRQKLEVARARIGRIAEDNGLRALPSATNFVTVDCGRDGDFSRRILHECQSRGLFIRMPGVAPLDRCIRISLGPEDALDLVEAILPEALHAARG